MISPPLGGLLFGVFRGMPFLADAISFAASAAAVAAVRVPFQRLEMNPPATSLRSDAIQGLRWMWAHGSIRALALTAAALQVAVSGVSLVVIISARSQHASSTEPDCFWPPWGLVDSLGHC